jgi:hypothetical protein
MAAGIADGREECKYRGGQVQFGSEGQAMSVYEINRAKIPFDELKQYDGQWVAFRKDGSRIVAGSESLEILEEHLTRSGQDLREVTFERLEFDDDSCLGGAEFLW